MLEKRLFPEFSGFTNKILESFPTGEVENSQNNNELEGYFVLFNFSNGNFAVINKLSCIKNADSQICVYLE